MKKVIIILTILLLSFPSFARRRTKIVRCMERMNSGIEAFERGRFSRAVNHLSIVRNECAGEFDNPDSIYFFLGLSYMRGGKPEDARLEFRTIIEEYPHSEFIERTYYYIAYCSFRAAPIIQRDNRLLRRAEREFSAFIAAYPNSELADSARFFLDSITDKLLEKEILNAEFYEIIRKHESAVIYYQVILEDFAGHRRIPEIRLRLARNLVLASRFAEALAIIEALESQGLYISESESLRRRINNRKRNEREARRRARS
jgi:outer membrane assembly lipoprotein YfiO